MTFRERTALRVAVFAAGAILMALEVAAFRIIGKTFGTALRETTTVIAVFLAAMSIGYFAGGRAGDRWPRVWTLTLTLILAAATMLVVPILDRTLSSRIAESGLSLAAHAFVATTVLFAIPTVLLAAVTPMAVRLFATSTGHAGSVAGGMSALSTIGSIAGSVATAFFLIDYLGSINQTVTTLATATLIAAVLAVSSQPAGYRAAMAALVALAGILVLNIVLLRATAIDASAYRPTPGNRILLVRDSPYHHITVWDRRDGFRDMSFDVGVQSRMRISDPFGLGAEYTDYFHFARLLRPETRRILMIGLGGGTAAKQFTKWYPDARIDAVEVDPAVVDIAREFFLVPQDPRLNIVIADGRVFLKRSAEKYDLIIIDAYTTNRYGSTIPAHLTTREFFQEAAAHLTENGFLHFHVYQDREAPLPRALYKTLKSVFSTIVIAGGTELMATNAPLADVKGTLIARAPDMSSRLTRIGGQIPTVQLDPLPTGEVPVLTDDYAPVDMLLRRGR
jgi:spermidine synthase